MTMNRFIAQVFLGLFLLFLMSASQAGGPLWTFTPLTATTISLPSNKTATIQYKVTNQSRKTYTLTMSPIHGISQTTTMGNCSNPFTLSYQQSCILTLEIAGNALGGNVVGGPKICQQGSSLLCYQPSTANSLNITSTNPIVGAAITVTGSPIGLVINGTVGTLTIRNTSTDSTAINITSNFAGTALDGHVTETGNTCAAWRLVLHVI